MRNELITEVPPEFRDMPSRCVGKLEIVNIIHQGNVHDGYGWILRIDGKLSPEIWPDDTTKREKALLLAVDCGFLPIVLVTWRDGSKEVLVPDDLDVTVVDLVVKSRPDRFPCQVSIGGTEPNVKTVRVLFKTGANVTATATVEFMPKVPALHGGK